MVRIVGENDLGCVWVAAVADQMTDPDASIAELVRDASLYP